MSELPLGSDRFFRLLVESVQDYAIVGLTVDGRVATWNEGAQRIKGWTEQEILGRPYAVFFPPEDIARGRPNALLEAAQRAGRVEDEGWRVRKDGSRFWADAVLTALKGEDGRLLGFAKVTRDLTVRRQAERQSRQLLQEQAARKAAEDAAHRLQILASAGAALAASAGYGETLETAARAAVPELAEFCALDLLEEGRLRRVAVVHPDEACVRLAYALGPGSDAPTAAWQAGSPEYLPEVPAPPPGAGPEHHHAVLRALGLRSAIVAPVSVRGRLLGTLTFGLAGERRFQTGDLPLAEELARRSGLAIESARLLRDLESAHRQLQAQAAELEAQTRDLRRLTGELALKVNEAEAARAVAEEANRAKSRFLAAMSHELRTPLNAIAGYADLLALGIHGALSEGQQQSLGRIQRNEQRLLALINDIIAFAKLEAGQLRFVREAVPVSTLLDDVEELVAPAATAKGIELRRLPLQDRLQVLADPEKTGRILWNIADNAVKFTDSGGIVELGARAAGDEVHIWLHDTGRGIPASRLETIFEPFVQVDQGHTREQEGLGLGLGLAISRELARNMDGDVLVESEPGRGSTFTLKLPRAGAFEAAA